MLSEALGGQAYRRLLHPEGSEIISASINGVSIPERLMGVVHIEKRRIFVEAVAEEPDFQELRKIGGSIRERQLVNVVAQEAHDRQKASGPRSVSFCELREDDSHGRVRLVLTMIFE